MKKLFILIIKIFPILQMLFLAIGNLIYIICGYNHILEIMDYIFGVNIISIIFLLVCSLLFRFCVWHRVLIFTNFISTFIIKIIDLYAINSDVYDKFIILITMLCIGAIITVITKFKFKI